MNSRPLKRLTLVRWVVLSAAVAMTAIGCASRGTAPASTTSTGSENPTSVIAPPSSVAPPSAASPASLEPDTGTTSGDVPDNAVYLTYRDPKLGFTIQYVEGWQVTDATDGVGIRDKDSSEKVQVVSPQADVAAYVSGKDLPALRGQTGFNLIKQDTVRIKGTDLVHVVYDISSPPDPVTGKQVPSSVDRYYVPGPQGLAIVSLATPKGVDNVDAFRQMIESFRWA